MTCLEALEYISRDIDGDLTAEEKAELIKHIESCDTCRKEYEEMKNVVENLRKEPLLDLPSGFHDELMEKLNESKVVPLKPANKKPYYKKYIAVAAAVCFFVIAGISTGGLKLVGVGNSSGTSSAQISAAASSQSAATSVENSEGVSKANITPSSGEENSAANAEESSQYSSAADSNGGVQPREATTSAENTETEGNIKSDNSKNTAPAQNKQLESEADFDSSASGSSSNSITADNSNSAAENENSVSPRAADAQPFMVTAEMPNSITVKCSNKEVFLTNITEYVQSLNGSISEEISEENENMVYVSIPKENYTDFKNVLKENAEIISDDYVDGNTYSSIVIQIQQGE